MSKTTLNKEIVKELKRLNDKIDRKIIKGVPFRAEARRHRELLATLRSLECDTRYGVRTTRRTLRSGRSPVHKSLAGGSVRRLFGFRLA